MKKLLSIVAAIMIAATSFAQVDEVTLTVIGTGVNEEQATLQALRSAIEQSFGTFVSANTTILNDELVQDEIVSVSNGNVKNYKKLAVATLPNNQVSVSLTATVSINKLISYAKSKGSRAEFEGQTYAANAKLLRLKVQSTEKAIKLMTRQLEQISKYMFDFNINLMEPKLCDAEQIGKVYYFDCQINTISNIASTNFSNLYFNTLEGLILTEEEFYLCLNENIDMVNIDNATDLRYEAKNYSPSILPMKIATYEYYNNKIKLIIEKALYRYSICEIGNPSNSYEFRKCNMNDGCRPICIGYGVNERLRRASKGSYLLYSKKWDELIHLQNGVSDFAYMLMSNPLPGRNTTDSPSNSQLKKLREKYLPAFSMTEVRTPIKLSKQEQKQVKNGTFTGATYTVSYTDPKFIDKMIVRVAIPANSIESFQGFELKY